MLPKTRDRHRSSASRVMLRAVQVMAVAVALVGLTLTAPAQTANDITDADITTAIENELWIDDAVDANNIDVQTVDGVVTFTGTADHILAKERAATIAAATVGVRSVVNRIEVTPTVDRTDNELAQAVDKALLDDPAADAYEVTPSANFGRVTLTGTVDSWQEKQLCSMIAKGVPGVKSVENNLVIEYEGERPDTEIKPEIEQRLANDIRVDDFLINVEVDNGAVELSGTVGSLTEKNRAISDAWVGGVRSVDADDLTIEWWARDEMRRKSTYVTRPDDEIEAAVEDAFLYDPRLSSFNVEATVDDGTVTLTGIVDNLEAKQAAERDARNTIGVWRVKNHVKVQPQTIPPNAELAERVEEALANNPYVSRYDVMVDANYGWVTLNGTVNNSFEKTIAKAVASGVKGVTGVTNNLDYEYVWSWKPDWEIREDVNDQLFWNPFVDGNDVDISVNQGIVTLEGKVRTWSEKYNAEEAAWKGGAKDVRNDLTVTYEYYGPYPPLWPYLSPDNTVVEYHSWHWPPLQ